MLAQVDRGLATQVADGLGLAVPAKPDGMLNHSVPADGDPKEFQPIRAQGRRSPDRRRSAWPAPSRTRSRPARWPSWPPTAWTRPRSPVSCAPLTDAGAVPKIIAPRGGTLKGAGGGDVAVDWSLLTVGSVLFDAVFVPGGARSTEALGGRRRRALFVREAYKHCKAVGGGGTGLAMLRAAGIEDAITRCRPS